MVNIKLSESEKSEFVLFYQLELNKAMLEFDKAQKRVEALKKFLGKFNGVEQITIRSKQKKVEPKGIFQTQSVQWTPFVCNTLKQHGNPMTIEEIINVAKEKHTITSQRKASDCISSVLRRMKKKGRITAEIKPGYKVHHYKWVSSATPFFGKFNSVEQTTVGKEQKKVEPKGILKTQSVQWTPFVCNTLKLHGNPMTIEEFINLATEKFAITNREKVSRCISSVLRRMRKTGRITAEIKPGYKVHHYKWVPSATSATTKAKAVHTEAKTAQIEWQPFIINTLKQQNKLLTRFELLKFASEKFNVPDRNKALKAIGDSIRRMISNRQLMVQTKPGDLRSYYSLIADNANDKQI